MKTIVRAMCPHVPQIIIEPRYPSTMGIVDQEEDVSCTMAVDTGRDRVRDPQGPFPMEDIVIGNDVQIDWDDWGSTFGFAWCVVVS